MSLLKRAPQPRKPSQAALIQQVRDQLRQELVSMSGWPTDLSPRLFRRLDELLPEVGLTLSQAERERLLKPVILEKLGFSTAQTVIPEPLAALLADESVEEVQINGPKQVYVRQRGQSRQWDVAFDHEAELLDLLAVLVGPLVGPLIEAQMPGGLMVTAVLPPVALNGPVITIRRLSQKPLMMEDLIRMGMLSTEAAQFLVECVRGRINIVLSGGYRAGAEKLLDVLCGFIPSDERVIVIERQSVLNFQHPQRVSLLTVPELSVSDLIRHARYLSADRIILGEAQAGETWDWLQLRLSGHMASLYAFSARGAVDRLEAMAQMSGNDLPPMVVRRQIATSIQLIVHLECLSDGSQRIQSITEVQGMSGDVIILADLFQYERTSMEAGKISGRLRPTGLRPMLMVVLEDAGITIPPSVFGLRVRGDL